MLQPTRPTSYFQQHPEELLGTGRAHPTGAGLQRVLDKVAKANMHWLSNITCRQGRPGRPAPQPKTATPQSTVRNDSANWAGYVTNHTENYLGAYMEWPVHDVTVTPTNDAYSSTWPGIGTGSSQSNPLIQDGVQQEADCYLNAGITQCIKTNTPWFEIYPQEAEQEITNLAVHTLDYMASFVLFDPDTAQAYFEIDDLTTGYGVYAYQTVAPNSSGYIGDPTQAEWIVERPSACLITCEILPLVNFGTQPIAEAQAIYGLWSAPEYTTAGQDSPEAYDMYSCDWKTLLASTGSLSNNTDFSVTWKATGKAERC